MDNKLDAEFITNKKMVPFTFTLLLILPYAIDSNLQWPTFISKHRRHRIFSTSRSSPVFDVRGGSQCGSEGGNSQWIGVIDLRPEAEPDSITLVQDNSQVTERAVFVSDTSTVITAVGSEAETIQQTAAAFSIGKLSSTIYLVISYDFEHGKTVLHRTLGGSKLMNFVDGMRERWNELHAQINLVLVLEPSSGAATSSFLSCLPSSTDDKESEETNNETWGIANTVALGLTAHTGWNTTGRDHLVERLVSYFQLGGEQYANINPFHKVDVIGAWDRQKERSESDENKQSKLDDSTMKVILRHAELFSDVGAAITSNKESFQAVIQEVFESVGGKGCLTFL